MQRENFSLSQCKPAIFLKADPSYRLHVFGFQLFRCFGFACLFSLGGVGWFWLDFFCLVGSVLFFPAFSTVLTGFCPQPVKNTLLFTYKDKIQNLHKPKS